MRAATLAKQLLDLPGISVSVVAWHGRQLVVDVRLRSKKLICPECGYTTKARYDSREVPSWWRHLDHVEEGLRSPAGPDQAALAATAGQAR